MKSDQITEPGYYWLFRQGTKPRIVCVHDGLQLITFHGNSTAFRLTELSVQGEFIGPIKYPSQLVEDFKAVAHYMDASKAALFDANALTPELLSQFSAARNVLLGEPPDPH